MKKTVALYVFFVLFLGFCLQAVPCFATPIVTAGYGCTQVDDSTVEIDTAGMFRVGSSGMVVSILDYTPGTETTISMAVSFLYPAASSSTFTPMGDDNATSGYVSAWKKTWRASFFESGVYVPLEKEWSAVRLTFTLNGGSGGVFTVGATTH